MVSGAFYRQPDNQTHQVEKIELVIDQVQNKFKNNNITYILGGTDWDKVSVKQGSNQRAVNEQILKNEVVYNRIFVSQPKMKIFYKQ